MCLFLHQYGLRLLLFYCFGECLSQQRIAPEGAISFQIVDRPIVVLRGHKKPIYSLALSTNQKVVAASSNDGHIRVWSCRNGDTLFHRTENALATLVLSRDGRYLGVCCRVGDDYRIRLWGDNRLKWEYDHAESDVQQFGPLFSISMSADGKTMAFCVRRESRLKLFDVETGRSNGEIKVEGSINAFAFARTTEAIAIAYTSDDSKDRLGKSVVELWDVKNAKRSKIISQRHSKALHTGMRFSADDNLLAEIWNDNEVVRTDIRSGRITGRYHNKQVITEDVTFTPKNDLLILQRGSRANVLDVWNLDMQQRTFRIKAATDHIMSPSVFSSDGSMVVSATDGSSNTLWSLK